jgi:hypothetical protein
VATEPDTTPLASDGTSTPILLPESSPNTTEPAQPRSRPRRGYFPRSGLYRE